MSQNSAYAGIMLLTGVGIPIMAALSAGLGLRLESPAAASVVLFGVAMMSSLAILAESGGPRHGDWLAAPPWFYAAGLFIVAYVVSITRIGPKFGIGNAVFFVLLGQLASAATIDHFGLFGASRSELTLSRGVGIILMTIGVFFARKIV